MSSRFKVEVWEYPRSARPATPPGAMGGSAQDAADAEMWAAGFEPVGNKVYQCPDDGQHLVLRIYRRVPPMTAEERLEKIEGAVKGVSEALAEMGAACSEALARLETAWDEAMKRNAGEGV